MSAQFLFNAGDAHDPIPDTRGYVTVSAWFPSTLPLCQSQPSKMSPSDESLGPRPQTLTGGNCGAGNDFSTNPLDKRTEDRVASRFGRAGLGLASR